MKNFRLIDNLLGWLAFAIAAFTYCSTVEPTASFWDCPEFITTAHKLEVGHPPGAPFFMLTGNLFTQLTSDTTKVALMVNIMNALLSALTIMFLFWTISHLARKLVCDKGWVQTPAQLIAIEGSAMTGALAYCWSDTFWYSAVEGEVYAYSSLFTALVFWLMLKWEDNADKPHSDRWLILIAYLTGLSIGVHLLNLLCLPAIVLVYYYKRSSDATLKGSIYALLGSFVLVAAVLYGIVPGIVKVGGWFELLFVNGMSLPFNSGLITYIFLLVATVLWAIWETEKVKDLGAMAAANGGALPPSAGRHISLARLSFLLAVAMLGIPFYGYGWKSIAIGIAILAALYVLLTWRRDGQPLVSPRVMNTSLLCMLMIMVGYSSYALIVIRSTANTPMDQNSPEDIFTLGSYLNREQYGSRPLFYGQAYTSQPKLKAEGGYCVPVSEQGAPVYQRKEKATPDEPDRYEIQRYDQEYVYAQNMLFPRMYSDRHASAYESWLGGVEGSQVPYDRCGEPMMVKMPSQLENIRFFLSYQVNFMYWRYFLWNFAGRQNDIQGNGELEHGNWLTGISFIDNLRLGDQSLLPTELRENKGRNVFFCLPLLLGLIGLLWQTMTPGVGRESRGDAGIKQFWVVFFLFFMTGLAIVVYLNQTPQQPRERDYAYAGSFYAFAIWIGLGVTAIADWIGRLINKTSESITIPGAAVALLCLLVPVQMVSQTWDDHDRSDRYTCRDFGQNYLMSLQDEGNPIIFTNGDNDTFPLWYNQETEGVRTDARVCNLSYLQTDWYIDQMRRPAYDSPSVPISWRRIDYVAGTREGIRVSPGTLEKAIEYTRNDPAAQRELLGDNPYELTNIIDKWILSPNPDMQIFPTDSIVVTIDKEAVRRSGMMMAADSIPDVMHINLKGKRAIYKNEMMMYEMIARCNWERPLYVAMTVGSDNYGNLGDNFVQEGLANRITPFDTKSSGRRIDADRMYDNLMNRFRFGGIDKDGIYLDETVMRMCVTHRRIFALLATQLMRDGDNQRLRPLLEKVGQVIPEKNVPHSYASGSLELAAAWLSLNDNSEAAHIASAVATTASEYLEWYAHLPQRQQTLNENEILYYFYQLSDAVKILEKCDADAAARFEQRLKGLAASLDA